jgi:SAM-dependent methyltransferase
VAAAWQKVAVADLEDTRRTSFDRNAEQYDAVRPSYPDVSIDDLIFRSGIRPHGRIVEVGAGTGKATLQFARRSFSVLALEPGPRMAAVLRRKVADYPNVSILETTFEDWHGANRQFDLIVSAQAFHWVSPDVRYARAAAALRSGGAFGWVTNEKRDLDPTLRSELDSAYARWFPTAQLRQPYRAGVTLGKQALELEASGWFEPAEVHAFPWTATYTSRGYVDLLDTYSDHAVQPASVRDGLYAAITSVIDGRRRDRDPVRHRRAVRVAAVIQRPRWAQPLGEKRADTSNLALRQNGTSSRDLPPPKLDRTINSSESPYYWRLS